MSASIVPLIIVIAIIIVFSILVRFVPFGLYFTAIAAGVGGVNPGSLIGMRLRRVPQDRIVLPLIAAVKAGVPVTVNQLEALYLARGNVDRVVNALIFAHRAEIPLSFEKAAGVDLAGRNVLEAVQMSVNPKVVEIPPVKAVTLDGTEIECYARAILRSDIGRFVNSDEAALIRRIDRELSIAIACSESFQTIADDTAAISTKVLATSINEALGFEIVAIEITGVKPLTPIRTY